MRQAYRELVLKLAGAFWPGPFTVVLPKRDIIPDIVTAGLDTVAVRISAHPVFSEVLQGFGQPLAAPSANRFGRVSPTTAQHVLDELGGRIPMILDAGPTQHGIESTIVAVRDAKIEILRRGPITEEQLRGIGLELISHRQDAIATRTAERIRGIGFQPMNPFEEVSIREGAHLPHCTQEGATYAVNFRLADALPGKVLADWKAERREIVSNARRQKRDLTDAEQCRLGELFSKKIETYLDAGHGKCWLRDERIAKMVRDTLLHFDTTRYKLAAWCIMPNHVHAVMRPTRGYALSQVLQTWKSFSAHEANRLLGREGAFWQAESFDHLIRDEQDFRNQIRYVVENPTKAGLKLWPWVAVAESGIGFQPMSHRQDADATRLMAPGQMQSHYAPSKPLLLIDDAKTFSPQPNERIALLAWNSVKNDDRFVAIRTLSERQDLREAAANLFRYLRELDETGADLIVAERVPDQGLGAAIMDRLRRASSRVRTSG